MIPTFPFENPWSERVTKAIRRLLENPKRTLDIMVHVNAIIIIGFLPNLSDARPHEIPTNACDSENTSDSNPAYFATELVGTLNDLIISGIYG